MLAEQPLDAPAVLTQPGSDRLSPRSAFVAPHQLALPGGQALLPPLIGRHVRELFAPRDDLVEEGTPLGLRLVGGDPCTRGRANRRAQRGISSEARHQGRRVSDVRVCPYRAPAEQALRILAMGGLHGY